MKKFNEERTIARLYLNLKGGKRKKDDWISIATDLKRLSDFYKSPTETARKLSVSYELVRSIIKILDLPKEVQQLVKEDKILYDAAQRITRLRSRGKQIEVAKAVAGLTSHEARDIIQYAKRYPNADLADFKRRVMGQRPTKEELHLMIIPVRQETYRRLQTFSRKQKTSVQKLVVGMVNEWLGRQEADL